MKTLQLPHPILPPSLHPSLRRLLPYHPRPSPLTPSPPPLVFVLCSTMPNGGRGLARSPIPEAGREEGGATEGGP
ncbi:hypothetical protein E2C01_042149 [Portunus trituberculatus]|uniref:Uncharacterized protein n=1 Tax=Portunus trituberculatus TaxID=210409 RepID=A0A5B7FTZ6_PORTR|nr:hypothetical protein [Portunus trituberculatus]